MAKTLEELFRTHPLSSQGGKPAIEAFDIRNSKKDIKISASNTLDGVLLNNSAFVVANTLRGISNQPYSETFLEQETTGLRVIRANGTPILYGTELPRIITRSTPTLNRMYEDSNRAGSGGLLGDIIDTATDYASAYLGLPSKPIPSYVVSKLNSGGVIVVNGEAEIVNKKITQDRMNDLAAILSESRGTLVGQLISNPGNISTFAKGFVGNSIRFGKLVLRDALFGTRNENLNLPTLNFEKIFNPSTDGVTPFNLENSKKYAYTYAVNYGSVEQSVPNNIDLNTENGIVDKKGVRYEDTIAKYESDGNRYDLADKQKLDLTQVGLADGDGIIKFSEKPERIPKFSKIASTVTYNKSDFIENARKIKTFSDKLNEQTIYDDTNVPTIDGISIEDLDFVLLKFKSIPTGKSVIFRSTITGLTETLSPGWSSDKFIGSPFNYYTYDSIERSTSFNFKIYSLNAKEHKAAWNRLNFLTSLVYPQGYYESSAIIPPLIQFTLGDLYKSKSAYIENLSYTFDDSYPWQITDNELVSVRDLGDNITGTTTENMIGYKLPMIVDVNLSLKFLESRSNTESKKFYTFSPQT